MSDIARVYDYLKEAGTYYLATVDGNQARVRPFGTIHLFEDRLYIQTGLKKNVARQIALNPNVEICAMAKDGSSWIRVSGTLVLDERIEAQISMLNAYPSLKGLYQPGDGNTAVYYIAGGEAVIASFVKEPELLKF